MRNNPLHGLLWPATCDGAGCGGTQGKTGLIALVVFLISCLDIKTERMYRFHLSFGPLAFAGDIGANGGQDVDARACQTCLQQNDRNERPDERKRWGTPLGYFISLIAREPGRDASATAKFG